MSKCVVLFNKLIAFLKFFVAVTIAKAPYKGLGAADFFHLL